MYLAQNNITVPLESEGERQYALFNPLSGSFDLIHEDEYRQILSGEIDAELAEYLISRGYAFRSKEEEEALVKEKWEIFQQETALSQTQLLLIPSYGCNLACKYCYQAGMQPEGQLIKPEVIDAFFDYVEKNFMDLPVKPFVTLFGGEPLINSPAQRKVIETIVDRCAERGLELAVVTNGYDLVDYVDVLARAHVKEIQVTLDGVKEVHDARRGTANGRGSFDRIVRGIDASISRGFTINLRSVVDQENILDLMRLAEFAEEKGWLDLPPEKFKTQIGRNYELFTCYAKPQHLMSQAELWREFARISHEYPVLKRFHRPEFKGIKHLVTTREMYMASFDTCPAAKTEWVFDLYGDIYGCTASAGREEYKLGTFYPEVRLNQDYIREWQSRNVNNITECRDCRYNVICGGGCGVVAANKTGKVLAPDCRPIQDLMETGVNYYREEIMKLAEEGTASRSDTETLPGCGGGACAACTLDGDTARDEKHRSGCLVCGEPLVYEQTARPVECYYCGVQEESSVTCANHHYVCDRCHSQDILGAVERLCLTSNDRDPLAILNRVFALPNLNMHGPEYHSIVPAVITAAYANITGADKPTLVREAIVRGKDIKGGSCGLHGVCGAASGAGIAWALVNNAGPLDGEGRSGAMRATAAALAAISAFNAPRCCKREAAAAVMTAMALIPEFEGYTGESYVCSQFRDNRECIKRACAYFPRRQEVKEEMAS